jgi:hypothetical protein
MNKINSIGGFIKKYLKFKGRSEINDLTKYNMIPPINTPKAISYHFAMRLIS